MPTSSKQSAKSSIADDVKRHRNPIKPLFRLSSLMGSFVIALGLGLLFHSLFRLFQQHHLPRQYSSSTTLPSSPSSSNTAMVAKDKWESVSYHGDISIQRNPIDNTQLYEYRYWLETNIPQQTILKILEDPDKTHEWMPWLVDREVRQEIVSTDPLDKSEDVKKMITKFRYIMPYPGLHIREVVAYHTVQQEPEALGNNSDHNEERILKVQSLAEDDPNSNLFPLCHGCKRAFMDLKIHLVSSKTLKDEGGDNDVKTHILLEQRMNPFVSKLPLFMVNAMNQKWGIAALHKLVRMSNRNPAWDRSSNKYLWNDWKRSFNGLFPVEG